jgi:HEAT repeat protein
MSPLRKSPNGSEPGRPEPEPERTLDLLLADLEAGDPEVRRQAVAAVTDRPEALPTMIRRVGSEPDRLVREALCSQLARHDLPAVVDGLIEHLASDDAGLRNAVAEVLAKTPTSTAPRVPELLIHPDPDVRILTVMLLAGLRLPDVEAWLTQLVRTDPLPNVVSAAIGELVALVGPGCEPTLHAAAERFPDDPFIGFAVSQALTALNRENA